MDELENALSEFVNQRRGKGMIPVKVAAVDTVEMTFDGIDGDGNEYPEVRLNAITGGDGVLVVPRVGSTAMIVDLGNREQDYVMLQAGQVDQIHLNVDELTTIYITDDQIDLGTNNLQPAVLGTGLNENLQTLIDQLDSLLTHLQTFTASQGAAAAGVLAPLAPAYTALAAQLPPIRTQLVTLGQQLDGHLSDHVNLTP